MGSTYDQQQTENSHKLVKEASSQTNKIKIQLILASLTLVVSVGALVVAIIALK